MKSANILIVEDDDATAGLIKLLLAGRGYNVCGIVSSGEEAVKIAIKTSPDLDIKLNGDIDGIMACYELSKVAKIPIVFVSAFTDKNIIDRAVQCNPSGYVFKPFKSEELLRKVDSVLTGKGCLLRSEGN